MIMHPISRWLLHTLASGAVLVILCAATGNEDFRLLAVWGFTIASAREIWRRYSRVWHL